MRAFIKQLLNKVPESRLGGSFVSLKSHKLFEDMDWVFTYYSTLSRILCFIKKCSLLIFHLRKKLLQKKIFLKLLLEKEKLEMKF